MRQLTSKQKKILDKFIVAQTVPVDDRWKNNGAPFKGGNFGLDVDDVPNEIWEELIKINNTEILYQTVNGYVSDESCKVRHKHSS